MVGRLPGVPWHSVEKAKLPCGAIQSKKLTPCSPFSVQGQSSPFWITPSLLFLTRCFVGLNGSQHVSWPGQPLAKAYKSYTWQNNCKEGCHAASQAALARSRGGLAVKSDGFICTPVSGVNNNCFMQNLLSIKLFSCLWSHLAITKPSSGADVFYSGERYIYIFPFDNLLLLPAAITNIYLK